MGSQKGIKQTSIGRETGGVTGGDGDGDEESTLEQRKRECACACARIMEV